MLWDLIFLVLKVTNHLARSLICHRFAVNDEECKIGGLDGGVKEMLLC